MNVPSANSLLYECFPWYFRLSLFSIPLPILFSIQSELIFYLQPDFCLDAGIYHLPSQLLLCKSYRPLTLNTSSWTHQLQPLPSSSLYILYLKRHAAPIACNKPPSFSVHRINTANQLLYGVRLELKIFRGYI